MSLQPGADRQGRLGLSGTIRLPLVSNPAMATRAAIAVLFVFALAIQLRSSLDSIHVSRHLDFYLPFTIAPFSARVESKGWSGLAQDQRTRLKRGEEILTVNGRAFTGLSVLMQELSTQKQGILQVGVRAADGRERIIEIGKPHCTCGTAELWEVIIVYLAAPLFCVLLGFAMAMLQPSSWWKLTLMLSLSQLTLMPTIEPGFQLVSTVMIWTEDWLRVPAVGYQALAQNIWPAALIGATAVRWRVWLVAVFAAFACVQAILAIAWSEHYRELVWLYRILDRYQTEFILAALAATAALGFTWRIRLGVIWTSITLGAAFALYSAVPPITRGSWIHDSDNSFQFMGEMPELHLTPRFVVLVSAACMLFAGLFLALIASRLRAIVGYVLCLPLTIHVAGVYGNFWWMLGPRRDDRAWPLFVLVSTACGLLAVFWWVRGVCVAPRANAGPSTASD